MKNIFFIITILQKLKIVNSFLKMGVYGQKCSKTSNFQSSIIFYKKFSYSFIQFYTNNAVTSFIQTIREYSRYSLPAN